MLLVTIVADPRQQTTQRVSACTSTPASATQSRSEQSVASWCSSKVSIRLLRLFGLLLRYRHHRKSTGCLVLKLKYGAERAHIAKVLSHSRLTLRTPTLRVADSEREPHASLLRLLTIRGPKVPRATKPIPFGMRTDRWGCSMVQQTAWII